MLTLRLRGDEWGFQFYAGDIQPSRSSHQTRNKLSNRNVRLWPEVAAPCAPPRSFAALRREYQLPRTGPLRLRLSNRIQGCSHQFFCRLAGLTPPEPWDPRYVSHSSTSPLIPFCRTIAATRAWKLRCSSGAAACARALTVAASEDVRNSAIAFSARRKLLPRTVFKSCCLRFCSMRRAVLTLRLRGDRWSLQS
jgi:hypothetical protein